MSAGNKTTVVKWAGVTDDYDEKVNTGGITNELLITLGVLVVIAAICGGIYVFCQKQKQRRGLTYTSPT